MLGCKANDLCNLIGRDGGEHRRCGAVDTAAPVGHPRFDLALIGDDRLPELLPGLLDQPRFSVRHRPSLARLAGTRDTATASAWTSRRSPSSLPALRTASSAARASCRGIFPPTSSASRR